MRNDRREFPTARVLFTVRRYLMFFLLISFAVTCCMLLFLFSMQKSTGITLTKDKIELAAKLTFGNVMLISLLFTVIDGVRRWFAVTRPVRHITSGLKKIMNGDLTARITPLRGFDNQDSFNIIIDYFNRMAEELSGIETLRTDFIANVSHELKTPLSVIGNYGTLLQQPDISEEQRIEFAKAVTESARRLSELTSNILRLNKLENQQIFSNKQTYNLGEQLCECLLTFEDEWEKKGLEIETDIEDGVMIEGDAELLALVWNNLFSNALKFTETGGRISLELKREGGFAAVRVSDTGCGVSRENGAHIFEKFYQGDTSHAAKGNGLGLALVKRVIDIAGGDISVSSEVGKGSTFAVRLEMNRSGTV